MLCLLYLSYFDCISQPSLTSIYRSQVGVREATGRNDGRAVEMYLRSVNQRAGAPWCAAFVRWSFDSARIRTTIAAWSPTAHNARNLIYAQRRFTKDPRAGDVFTIWYSRLGRIGHTGFYDGRLNDRLYQTVEGNTNEAGSREGDGVYRKYRSFNSTYSITRWQ